MDWAIVIVIALAVLEGASQGFFRSACSLCGLLLGLVLAAWNYGGIARLLIPLVRFEPLADALGFLLIALLVRVLAEMAGNFLSRALHIMGLGFLDRLAGAAFGFFQGALLVTLVILVTIAFFPRAHWLVEDRLPKRFFRACHLSTHMSPAELAERVRRGLKGCIPAGTNCNFRLSAAAQKFVMIKTRGRCETRTGNPGDANAL
jgi:membrane protein required for colicin V production